MPRLNAYRLRRDQLVAMVGLIVGLPLAFSLARLAMWAFGLGPELAVPAAALLWAAGWWRQAWRVAQTPCPRCRHRFFGHALFSQDPLRACAHCGLTLQEAQAWPGDDTTPR